MSGGRGPQLSAMGTPSHTGNGRGTEVNDRARLRRSVMKFIVVGIINNVIGYGTFVILSLAGLPAIGAMTISYSLGMAISFAGNRRWTFGHQGRVTSALVRFLAVNAVGYGLNFAILTLLVVAWRFPQIPVQLLATGLVAVVTFLLMRKWAFRETSAEPKGDQKSD